jgi:transposase
MTEPEVEVVSQTVLDGLRLSDWMEQMGISRSAGYELLKLTGIEPEPRKVPGSRKPVSHLTQEQMAILQPLAQQLADGATMTQIKQQLEQSGTVSNSSRSSGMVSTNSPKQSGIVPADLVQLFTAMSEARKEPVDPLALAKRLAEAASLGVPLTNGEMAQVLGRASIGPKQDGSSPRPGFTIHRQEHNGTPFWIVERAGGGVTAAPVPSRQQLGKSEGIGFDVAAALIDVTAVDCSGSDLFDRMRL